MAASNAAARPPDEIRDLIASLRPDAVRLARHLLGDSTEAEDLAQTAMLRVLAHADSIADPDAARGYVLATVRNLWRNHLRIGSRRRVLQQRAVTAATTTEESPEDLAITALEAATARIAFTKLPSSGQEVIWLRYVDRLDYASIADRLAITPVAARQRVHRAREQLVAACIEAEAGGGAGRCRETRLAMGRLYRDRLTGPEASAVHDHLRDCARCAECYAQLVDSYGRHPSALPATD